MIDNGQCYLREATEEDMLLIFNWANDSDVRKNSFCSKQITFKEHTAWYDEVMKKRGIIQYILVHDGVNIGQIRITIQGKKAEIGYSIATEYRCMGYGKKIFLLLEDEVRLKFPQITTLVAKVKPDNRASIKALTDIGFKEKYSTYEYLTFELNLNENARSNENDIINQL